VEGKGDMKRTGKEERERINGGGRKGERGKGRKEVDPSSFRMWVLSCSGGSFPQLNPKNKHLLVDLLMH